MTKNFDEGVALFNEIGAVLDRYEARWREKNGLAARNPSMEHAFQDERQVPQDEIPGFGLVMWHSTNTPQGVVKTSRNAYIDDLLPAITILNREAQRLHAIVHQSEDDIKKGVKGTA